MIFSGSTLRVELQDKGIAHLILDYAAESVNKFNQLMTQELEQALDKIEANSTVRGLLISSAKSVFIVGADIAEFGPVFKSGPEGVAKHIRANIDNFNRIEGLPFPTVVAINGYALGGGMEIAFGLDTAIEWICGGNEHTADQALRASVADGVVEPDQLIDSATEVLIRAMNGKLPYAARREQKSGPILHNDTESLLAFESSKMFVGAKAGKHYPAPVAAIKAMQDGAKCGRDEAQKIESEAFVRLSQTPAAINLVTLFLNDQAVGKTAKKLAAEAQSGIERAAILGAGIMGGGIAYQSAVKGVPTIMKDIAQEGLDLGLSEAKKLLVGRVDKKKISLDQMGDALNRIQPTLSYTDFASVDLVVEAVVENPKVKMSVLSELENEIGEDTIICTNTSTISIDSLAQNLKRPENFCGMHFFNPVHKMPLVEVIRGSKTSAQAIAKTVSYANKLGKKPVVVNNCPGFFVNRVLFPYFSGFAMLLKDGADFQHIDKVMEKWGFPMGPAYLLDVVGMDTAVHADKVMADGFSTRMKKDFKTALEVMYENGRFGQKNGKGFYKYELDKKGKPKKSADEEVDKLLSPVVCERQQFSDEDIVFRMMIPMANEVALCLEEGIVETPAEADTALIYGIGFPPFRGGILRWLDEIGFQVFVDQADKYQHLGPLYSVPKDLVDMSKNAKTYYEL